MHSLVLCFESKDVLRALSPGLSIGGVDVCKNVGNPVFKVFDGFGVGVEVASAVPIPIKILVTFKSVVAVNRNQKLDAIAVCLDHELVETVQHSVVPRAGRVSLKFTERIYGRAFGSLRLALDSISVAAQLLGAISYRPTTLAVP